MVSGRRTRFLHSLISKDLRVVKHPMDDGNTSIDVLFKERLYRLLKFARFSGKLTNFEHLER